MVSYSPFLMIDTVLTSLQYFEFFPSPSWSFKDSSKASGIALGDSLGSQWWISSGMNLNTFEITKWYWTYPVSDLAFILLSFEWIAVTFALSESFSWRLKQNGKIQLSFLHVTCCPPPLNGEPILYFISLWFQMHILIGIK